MGGAAGTGAVRLACVGDLAVEPLLRFLAAHAVPGVEGHDPLTRSHTRLVPGPHGPALVRVAFPGGRDGSGGPDAPGGPGVEVTYDLAHPADEEPVRQRVRDWLDLDTDHGPAQRHLARDELLAPLVAARPGLRVPGSVDGVETALLAVLGQQVSLAAARTFAARLLGAFGEVGPGGLRWLPTTAGMAAAGPARLQQATGVTHARARTLHALASAAADGLRLDAVDHRDPGARALTRRALLALPGIGPWTADYVALRCLRDPDAFLAGDLVLRRALGVATAREAELRAEVWRPYRGLALLHLWTAAVFA